MSPCVPVAAAVTGARRGRRVALAGATVVLGAGGHLAAGGSLGVAPASTATALLLAALVALLVGASRRGGPARPARVATALAGGQLALHLALAGVPGGHGNHGAGHGATAADVAGHGAAGHTMSAVPADAVASGPVSAGAGAMLLAHLLVVLVLTAAATRADRAIASALAARRRTLALLRPRPARPAPAAGPRLRPAPPAPAVGVLFARVIPRRGPPPAGARPAVLAP